MYKLFAIVHHYGHKGNGHYITEAMDLGSNDDWYRCDDETISQLTSPPITQSSTAYVLFYQKTGEG